MATIRIKLSVRTGQTNTLPVTIKPTRIKVELETQGQSNSCAITIDLDPNITSETQLLDPDVASTLVAGDHEPHPGGGNNDVIESTFTTHESNRDDVSLIAAEHRSTQPEPEQSAAGDEDHTSNSLEPTTAEENNVTWTMSHALAGGGYRQLPRMCEESTQYHILAAGTWASSDGVSDIESPILGEGYDAVLSDLQDAEPLEIQTDG